MADPRRWSSNELEMMANQAIGHFRHQRSSKPLLLYSDFFQAFIPVFTDLIDNELPKLAETNVSTSAGFTYGVGFAKFEPGEGERLRIPTSAELSV